MIVYSGGSFDLFHHGHLQLLFWCRELAGPTGEVVIALNSDEFIEQYKGKKPMFSYEERKSALTSLPNLVSKVITNSGGSDSKPAILSIKPDIIAIGSDWLRKDYLKQMDFTVDFLEENDITLAYIPRHLKISSTEIKKRITQNA